MTQSDWTWHGHPGYLHEYSQHPGTVTFWLTTAVGNFTIATIYDVADDPDTGYETRVFSRPRDKPTLGKCGCPATAVLVAKAKTSMEKATEQHLAYCRKVAAGEFAEPFESQREMIEALIAERGQIREITNKFFIEREEARRRNMRWNSDLSFAKKLVKLLDELEGSLVEIPYL